jgi:hypothetical protein
MSCPKAKIFINFHGKVIAEHVADRSWDLNKFVLFLRQKGVDWRTIYWRLWGRLIVFDCNVCEKKFIGSERDYCSYHPSQP